MLPSERAERAERPATVRRLRALSMAGLAVLTLGACSAVDAPIRWYRDATGVSKNDTLGEGSNQKNLEAGSKQPYPNLAEVPQPPENAMSSMDREALRQSLAADRQNAQYTQDQLQAGSPVPGMVASPPPPAAPPDLSPPKPPAAKPAPVKETPPAESTLSAPQLGKMPEGETAAPPPPPPQIQPSPAVTESPIPRAEPPAPAAKAAAPARTATQTASVQPAPAQHAPAPPAPAPSAPPPPPQITATAPPPRPTGPAAGPGAVRQTEVADVTFAPDSSQVAGALRGTLTEVASLHQTRHGKLRIVGYAQQVKGANSSKQDLARYNLALERAKSVAASLTELGVPAGEISVEAAVEAAGDPRAEIYMNNK